MPRVTCTAFRMLVLFAPTIAGAQVVPPPDTPARSPVRVGGVLQLRETYQDDALTATVHRARLLLDGTLGAGFTFRFSGDFRSGGSATTRAGVALVDAYIQWTRDAWAITAGQFKTPFTREYLMGVHTIETANRAAVSESLAPRRDIGVLASYTRSRASFAFGVFNGEGVNSVVNRDSSVLVAARVTARAAAALDFGANVAVYGGDSTRYGIDALWERGRFLARAELIGQHHVSSGAADDYGWYALGLVQASPAVHLVLRQEDMVRPAGGPARDIATTVGGLFDFAERRVRLFVNYTSRKIDGDRRGALITQLQLWF